MTLEDKIVLIRTIIDDPIGGWVTPSLIKQILDNTEIFHAFIAAKILCRMSGQDFTIPEFTDVESMLRLFTEFLEKDKAIKEDVGAKEDKKPREFMIGIDNKNAPIAIDNCNVAGFCDYLIGKNAFQTKEVIKVREVVE